MAATVNTERVSVSRDIPGIGRLDFEQTDKRREYWLLPEGNQRRVRLPSVTTILRDTWPKPQLLEWYAREGNASAILAAASARGKSVHRFIETYFRDGILLPFSEFDPAIRPWLQGAARFIWERQPEPAQDGVERLVCHPELRYAGRLDLLAREAGDSQLTLWDFKTNPQGNVYAEAHVQAWAYALADFKCGGEPIGRRAVVGLSERGTYEVVQSPDAEELWGLLIQTRESMRNYLRLVGEAVA
jgi:hypothetical protein